MFIHMFECACCTKQLNIPHKYDNNNSVNNERHFKLSNKYEQWFFDISLPLSFRMCWTAAVVVKT